MRSNSGIHCLDDKEAQKLNICFDILIDEERFDEVYNPFDDLTGGQGNEINKDLTELLDKIKKNDTRKVEGGIKKFIQDQWKVDVSNKERKLACDEKKWKPLFFAKWLRARLQSAHSTEALESLDEVGAFLISQIHQLEPQTKCNRSSGCPDFEVLYYLEAAACYKEDLSIGYAQKALDKINESRQKDKENGNEKRGPYELVAIYNKGVSLYHGADLYKKERAIKELDQIIAVFEKGPDGKVEWDEKYKKQAKDDGTENLWKRYVYLPAIICKAEALIDLQRAYECNKMSEKFKEANEGINEKIGEREISFNTCYPEMRYEILSAFARLDTGEFWESIRFTNCYDEDNKQTMKKFEKVAADNTSKIANLFPGLSQEDKIGKEKKLSCVLKEIKEKVLNREGLLNQKHLFKSLVARILKDLENLRFEKCKSVSDYLYMALDIPLEVFKDDKLDKDERAEGLKQWLESFEVLVNFLLNGKISDLKESYSTKSGCEKRDHKSFFEDNFSFLKNINNNVKCVQKGEWLNYRKEIEEKAISILQTLNDNSNLEEKLASFDSEFHDEENNILPLKYCLLISEVDFILYLLNEEVNPKLTPFQTSKYIRRLERLKDKLKQLKDKLELRFSEQGDYLEVLNKITNKLNDENYNGLKLPKDEELNHAKNFSRQINRDRYLKIMRQNTENFDDRLIYGSVRYKDKYNRLENSYGLTVLRKWQSYTPSLAGGPVTSLGGGYFVYKTDKQGEIEEGIVIDPGFDFVENFFEHNFSIRDITAVVMTHDHIDHNADFRAIVGLFNEANKRGRKRHGWKEHKMYVISTGGCFTRFSVDIKSNRDFFHDTVVADLSKCEPLEIFKHFIVEPAPAYHQDLARQDCMGVVIKTRGGAPLLGFTGDTVWTEELAERYKNCPVMCINMGGIIDVRKDYCDCFEKVFDKYEDMKNLIYKENHLYLPGFMLLMEKLVKEGFLQMVIISEIGEEFKGGLREDLAKRIEDYCKMQMGYKHLRVLVEDIGMTVSLPVSAGGLCVKCDKCKEMIPADKVHVVTRTTSRGVEQLYHYCDKCYECYLRLTESEKQDF